MKVMFWSLYHGQCAVSASLAAISTNIALRSSKKSLILHNQLSHSMIEKYLGLDAHDFGRHKGLDPVLNNLKNQNIKPGEISSHAVSLLNSGRLDVLIGSNHDEKTAPQELTELINGVIDLADRAYDIVYIDSHAGDSREARSLMEIADVIVICINQNRHILEATRKFYSNMGETRRKVQFLVGNYDSTTKMTLKNIERIFRVKPVYAVANSGKMLDAINQDRFIDFIHLNSNADRYDDNYEFSSHLERTSEFFEGLSNRRVVN